MRMYCDKEFALRALKIIFGILSLGLVVFIGYNLATAGFFGADGIMNFMREVVYLPEGTSFILACLILISGIILLACNGKRVAGGEIVAGILYLIAAIVGVVRASGDQMTLIYTGICLLFGLVMLIGHFVSRSRTLKRGMINREQFTGQIPIVPDPVGNAQQEAPAKKEKRTKKDKSAMREKPAKNDKPAKSGKHAKK